MVKPTKRNGEAVGHLGSDALAASIINVRCFDLTLTNARAGPVGVH
jgi:hypothetical protein